MTDEQRALLKLYAPDNGLPDMIDVEYSGRALLSLVAGLCRYVIWHEDDVNKAAKLFDQSFSSAIELWERAKRARSFATMPYEEYLATPEWQARAAEVKLLRGNRCEKCGSRENLHAHHLTYEHRGHEPLGDLQVLCELCHKAIHAGWF